MLAQELLPMENQTDSLAVLSLVNTTLPRFSQNSSYFDPELCGNLTAEYWRVSKQYTSGGISYIQAANIKGNS